MELTIGCLIWRKYANQSHSPLKSLVYALSTKHPHIITFICLKSQMPSFFCKALNSLSWWWSLVHRLVTSTRVHVLYLRRWIRSLFLLSIFAFHCAVFPIQPPELCTLTETAAQVLPKVHHTCTRLRLISQVDVDVINIVTLAYNEHISHIEVSSRPCWVRRSWQNYRDSGGEESEPYLNFWQFHWHECCGTDNVPIMIHYYQQTNTGRRFASNWSPY